MALIERADELDVAVELLARTHDGHGGVLLIEGVAGIGKTALLAAIHTLAGEQRIRMLKAVGGELEQELPFAIVRQLVDPALRSMSQADRADVMSGAARLALPVFDSPALTADTAATIGNVVHGLYWMCSNLAEHGPLLVTVDDVHWADEASLRFVSHLARQITDLPVLLILSGRPQPPGAGLGRVLTGVDPNVVVLHPLSDPAVGQLVREALSADADDEFCRACAKATGGNPFLLAEALSRLRADQVRPIAAEAAAVESLCWDTIAHFVLARVARLGPDAIEFARALAVLGPAAELRRAASLAGIPLRRAAQLREALAREDIIAATRPIEFAHPLVRTAIYAEAGEFGRAVDHKRAARLLAAEGLAAHHLVPHLLAAEPEGDPQVVVWLRAAAGHALSRGAPEAAAACLRRAIAEPAPPADRVPILADLGWALGMANNPIEAADALRTAIDLADDPNLRAEVAIDLGNLMVLSGRPAEAHVAFEQARHAIGLGEAEFLRHPRGVALAMAGFAAMEPPAKWIARLELVPPHPGDDLDRMIAAALAFGTAVAGDRPATETVRLATRAADGPLPASRDCWMLVNFASAALAIADRSTAALELLDRGIEIAQHRGDATEFRYMSMVRSHTALFAGRLLEAEADGRAALNLDIVGTHEIQLAAAVLVDALVERGSLAEAQAVLAERDMEGEVTVSMLIDHFILMARGSLRRRQQRPREALADFRRCGRALVDAGCTNPGFSNWRAEAALAHLALGERSAAEELGDENLELARAYQARQAVGIALRVVGLVAGGDAAIGHLAESVAVLEGAEADLDLARSLTDYGAALRRSGHRTDARHPLRRGLDLAERCGSRPLVARANAELVAAGARPRRAVLTGPDSLTAAELRVARRAADGATNREIAQILFVSRRTVEIHLTNAYRKLQIDSRQHLTSALDVRT